MRRPVSVKGFCDSVSSHLMFSSARISGVLLAGETAITRRSGRGTTWVCSLPNLLGGTHLYYVVRFPCSTRLYAPVIVIPLFVPVVTRPCVCVADSANLVDLLEAVLDRCYKAKWSAVIRC